MLPTSVKVPTFRYLGVHPTLRERLRNPLVNKFVGEKSRRKIFEPMPVQEILIPTLLSIKPTLLTPLKECRLEKDIVHATGKYDYKRLNPNHAKKYFVRAATAQGKTLSFILPILQMIFFTEKEEKTKKIDASKETSLIVNNNHSSNNIQNPIQNRDNNNQLTTKDIFYPQVLIIVPTRELCSQIKSVIFTLIPTEFGNYVAVLDSRLHRVNLEMCEILITTPAKLHEWLEKSKDNFGVIDLKRVHLTIVDECDYLTTGENKKILCDFFSRMPSSSCFMFSASIGNELSKLLKTDYFRGVSIIDLTHKQRNDLPQKVKHFAIEISEADKLAALYRILKVYESPKVLIFVNKRKEAEDLALDLHNLDFKVQVLHGEFPDIERKRRFGAFVHNRANILICTDILSRGIDFPDCDLVISVRPPSHTMVSYVHRSGRTGRAEKEGKSVLLYYKEDLNLVELISSSFSIPFEHKPIPELSELNESIVSACKSEIKDAARHLGDPQFMREISNFMKSKSNQEIQELIGSGISLLSGIDIPLLQFDQLSRQYRKKIIDEEKKLAEQKKKLQPPSPHRLYNTLEKNHENITP